MQLHVNDLSLDGQFPTSSAFKDVLGELLQLRMHEPFLKEKLFCSRSFSLRPVTATANLQQTILSISDKNFIKLALEWLGKSGPFWDDNRQPNPDDYFEYEGEDVTDQGLGEAARRKLLLINSGVFSFVGSKYGFKDSILDVQHGIAEDIIAKIHINNLWHIDQLKELCQTHRVIMSWNDLEKEIKRRFQNLIFASDVIVPVLATPFNQCVTNRIIELLGVLSQLVENTAEDGSLTASGSESLANHFVGEKAWFSNESDRDRRDFRSQLLFKDPENPGQKLFCPWHGKIKTFQIRIHFEWPRPSNQPKIKVLYIGPKITKH